MTPVGRLLLRSLASRGAAIVAATATIALTIGVTTTPADAQLHFPDDADIQVMLNYLVAGGEAPGIVFGVLEADGSTRIVVAGNAIADGGSTRPLGARSVFEIGSINKTFTGILLAEMVARGEVSLEDRVSRYLPEHVRVPTRDGRAITLLHLATHRSGLPRLPTNHVPADMSNPYADYTVEKLYAFLSGHELRREPGAEYEYSNLGFGLLGHALARAAGTSYTTLLRERILEPLGMDMTGYSLEDADESAGWMVRGHSDAGDVVPYYSATEAIRGAGGLGSSMEDMLAYLRANVRASAGASGPGGSDLKRAMRAAHEARQRSGEREVIGLGWVTRRIDGHRIIGHDGGTGGFSASIGFDPELGVGYVLLANAADFGDDLGLDLLRFGRPINDPIVDVAPEILDRYAGSYGVAGQVAVVRHEEDGTMTVQTPGNVRFRLYPDSDTSFYLKRAPWRVSFPRGARGDGSAAVMALTIRGGTRTLPRVTAESAAVTDSPPEVLDLAVTADDIARYEGTYMLRVGERTLELRIFGQDGRVVSQVAGQAVAALRFQGDHVFVPEFDDSVRLVFTLEDGRATGVTLHQGGGAFPGERVR